MEGLEKVSIERICAEQVAIIWQRRNDVDTFRIAPNPSRNWRAYGAVLVGTAAEFEEEEGAIVVRCGGETFTVEKLVDGTVKHPAIRVVTIHELP